MATSPLKTKLYLPNPNETSASYESTQLVHKQDENVFEAAFDTDPIEKQTLNLELNEDQLKALNSFQSSLSSNISKESSFEFFKSIISQQGQMKNDSKPIEVAASDLFPAVIFGKNWIKIIAKKLGEGTFSNVFETIQVATQRFTESEICFSPSKPTNSVLKNAKKQGDSFSPEKKQLEKAVSPQRQGIDHYKKTFMTQTGSAYSEHVKFDKPFSSIDYLSLNDPAKYLLNVLKSSLSGLCSIHRHNHVHRDIKGLNTLVIDEKNIDAEFGAITDFGFLKEVSTEIHATQLTPLYADPAMFAVNGPVGALYNQLIRKGIQTLAGDVYAFGRMIECDGLRRLCEQFAKKWDLKDKLTSSMEKMKPELIESQAFSKEQLDQIDKDHPYLAVYKGQYKGKCVVLLFESIKERKNAYLNVFAEFENKGIFTQNQIRAFESLTELALAMQEAIPSNRISAEDALSELTKILIKLEGVKEEGETSPNTYKRKSTSEVGISRNIKRKIKFDQATSQKSE